MTVVRRFWPLPLLACAAALCGWAVVSLRTHDRLGGLVPVQGGGPPRAVGAKKDSCGNAPTGSDPVRPPVKPHTGTDSTSQFYEGTVDEEVPAPKDDAALSLVIHDARHSTEKKDRVQAIKSLRTYLYNREDDSHLDEVIRAIAQAAEFDLEIWVRDEAIQTLSFQVSDQAFEAFMRLGPLDADEPVRWTWVRRLDTLANTDTYIAFIRDTAPHNKPLAREVLLEIRKLRVSAAIEKLQKLILVESDAEIKAKAEEVLAKLKS